MATSAGEVEVKLSLNADDFKKALTSGQTQLSSFGSVLEGFATKLATAFSFAAVAGFFKDSLNAYAENQLSITRLVAALNNQGTATQGVVEHLTRLSEALQNQTGISKNAITEAQTLLTTFGIAGSTLDRVTQAALDLSAATGIDLQRAALLLGKAFDGQTSSLSRYGIVVNDHIDLNKRFEAVMAQVNQRFGGAAQAQADTYTGRLNIMKLAFQDLQEQIGAFIAGPAGGLVSLMLDLIRTESTALQGITEANARLNGFGNVLKTVGIELLRIVVDAMTAVLKTMAEILSHFPLMGTAMTMLKGKIDDLNKSLNAEIDKWQSTTQTAMTSEVKKQEAVLQTKTILLQSLDLESKAVSDNVKEETKLREKAAEDAKTAHNDFGKSFITTEADLWHFATGMSNEFFAGFGDGFAKMVIEGKNFTESLKSLFKNMAEEMISYIVQVIAKMLVLLALESALGFPVGATPGFSIGSIFSGAFAEGGMINEPSVILGLRSGSRILAGEAGPEAVVPMNGGGGQGGGGQGQTGNITINISGQFVDADPAKWRSMVNEHIVPAIRRFTMSSPTGPFNRTRGVV